MTILCEDNIDLDAMVSLVVIFNPGPGDAVQHCRPGILWPLARARPVCNYQRRVRRFRFSLSGGAEIAGHCSKSGYNDSKLNPNFDHNYSPDVFNPALTSAALPAYSQAVKKNVGKFFSIPRPMTCCRIPGASNLAPNNYLLNAFPRTLFPLLRF
jgi:hypothetical protein